MKETQTNIILSNTWLQFKFSLENKLLSNNNISQAFNKFYEEVISKITKDHYVSIIFRIKDSDNFYRNISNIQILNNENYLEVLENFQEFWSIKDEEYLSYSVSDILFAYKLTNKNFHKFDKKSPNIKPKSTKDKTNLLKIGGYNFPCTMDLYLWGDVVFYNNDTKAIVYKNKSKAEYHITFVDNYTMKIDYKLNEKVLLTFTDKLLDTNNLGSFLREIQNKEYQFKNGKLLSKSKLYLFPKIKPLKKEPYYINKFITLDIETKKVDNVIIPYAISYFDGKIVRSFYETDFLNPYEMLKTALSSLLIRKYHNYKVYIHNLSNFDGIFIFNILLEIGDKVTPIVNEGQFLNINVKFKDKYKLHFRDSYLMLPSSLKKLCQAFNVENKSIFPYRFVNNFNIYNDYNGDVPNFNFFDNITSEQYNIYCENFKNKKWNLRDETLKYCAQDVKSLYLVLDKFFKDNYLHNRVNGSKAVSLPNLAITNFRTNFMVGIKEISIIAGEIYHFIKGAYTGGAVDVYKPYGKKIYRYDVNSLYPYIMRNYRMPVGDPTFIEGNTTKIEEIIKDETKFIFVEVDVTCPLDLKIPLLLVRYKSKNGGYRSIAPVGKWSGVYTSIELKRALELGYTFIYKKAVYFEAEIIFKDYIDFYYDMKKNSPKDSPNYIISKLMLNSLYGRFGMKPHLPKHVIVNEGEHLKLMEEYNVIDVYPLIKGKELISYEDIDDFKFDTSYSNVNIAIAAAITAGGRVYMSYFKHMKGITIYYSDTDSIDIDKPLQSKYVGTELGQLKLEHIFEEAVYLAPKMYGGITKNYELIKVKGLKNPVSFNELKSLLKLGSSLETPNQKWYKSLNKGNITIKDEIYTISVTDNKRNLIFDNNNNFIDTKPIVL